MRPERSSSQSSGYSTAICSRCLRSSARVGFRLVVVAISACSVVGRVDGIEDLLDPVDVLTRADELVLVDLRLRAGPVDLRDRVLAQQNQPALPDVELVAVEGADRRAGGAVPFGVVLAAVARAPEAGGDGRVERDLAVRRFLLDRRQAEDLA